VLCVKFKKTLDMNAHGPHHNLLVNFTSLPADDIASKRLQDFLEFYLSHYASGDSHTARAKQLDVTKFLQFLTRYKRASQAEDLLVKDWSPSATQHFVDDCLATGEAPSTASRRLATLKHIGRIFADKIPGFINPAREIKSPKVQPLRPKSLNAAEITGVLEKASELSHQKNSFSRRRNEVLVRFLLDTGLRADEVRTIRRGQLDGKCEWIEQVRTKGRRYRNVYITAAMRQTLLAYLEERSEELRRFLPALSSQLDSKLPLFISTHGSQKGDPSSFQMSPKTVWRAIRECTVETKLHPHLLRHTYAVELLEDSRDIRLVAQALGHSDVRVTMRYTERTDEEVASALERARAKNK
jgi:integrase/recombinase XerC